RALNVQIPRETVTKQENITFLSHLLDSIGVNLGKPYQTLVNGVKTRIYSIDEEKLNLPSRLEILAAIERKFNNYLESEVVKKVSWEEHTPQLEISPQTPQEKLV
ncbi:MAG: hypothetical protein ACYT04_90730, partial [Nostoc sp.]